ncbi:MAG: indolepyruvate ferredoxin oxidoreductase family protein [Alphaproteobacteria bacterium]|nr:indolepyruvate ferredoxin oxidoreductase family protein [Alphaproteobacteria bacterium]
MALAKTWREAISLDDKYTATRGRIYLTGTQALVRVMLLQALRDRAAGLDTAGLVTGYRGSPMHNVDREFWRAARHTEPLNIRFQPAVNEDLAATALWGAQQAQLHGDPRFDGVFGLWYGKAPGLDRSLDALRHANYAGTSQYGGVLVSVGDDPPMMATDVPTACEPTFMDLRMPVLYPADVQDVVDLGLFGIALSRYCGAWVGFKAISDSIDAATVIDADPDRPALVMPRDYLPPPGGLWIRRVDGWKEQEQRGGHDKIAAARAFARANGVNRTLIAAPRPRHVILASGKVALDVWQALHDLGIDDATATGLGIVLVKIAMPWPLDPAEVRAWTRGAEQVLVVEEKRRVVETQVRDTLYDQPEASRPRVLGRHDAAGAELVPFAGELSPDAVSRALVRAIPAIGERAAARARIALLDAKAAQSAAREAMSVVRTVTFCSGCPHNTSTRVPEGSRAHGGVGCHFMAEYMDRSTSNHSHMGGEGAAWIGQAPFVKTKHIFQNLGDGTYYHSGYLGVRAAVAAKANITFKILFNDAVAMTGGQPHDGPLTPVMIAQQVAAESVGKVIVVSDEPEKYPAGTAWPHGTRVEHRNGLDRIQRECRAWPGVSVIIYDQTCAAEKRRRRKRGALDDPDRRMFINDMVCEGCGDCSAKSSCLSVLPLETEFGRKRRIDQSSCNKDYSCADGFCPSFVSVSGARLRRAAAKQGVPEALVRLPEPVLPALGDDVPWRILVTGVGGTGVATIGALLTMAAHLDGIATRGVDQFGMAQKGGPVTSHVQLARTRDAIRGPRLHTASADVLLACDKLVAAGEPALATIAPGRTRIVINANEAITGQFTRQPDLQFPSADIERRLVAEAGAGRVETVDATRLATALLGDAIAANLFVLGFAWQRGLVPLTHEALMGAIDLNRVSVTMNKEAFSWGRRAAVDLAAVTAFAFPPAASVTTLAPRDLDGLVRHRVAELTAYQNAAYAARYAALVERSRTAESERAAGFTGFAEAVARYAYKLMAYKDEYEVARLFTDGRFARKLAAEFEGDAKLAFHFSPPLFARTDPETGLPAKMTLGAWVMPALRLLAAARSLRGSWLDPFGYLSERRRERSLIAAYEATIAELTKGIAPANHALAVEIASVPERIRGYGYVKDRHLAEATACAADLLGRWRAPHAPATAAE